LTISERPLGGDSLQATVRTKRWKSRVTKAIARNGIGTDAGAWMDAGACRALEDARQPAVRQHGELVECIGQCAAACAFGHGI